jgi:hypothetical protein
MLEIAKWMLVDIVLRILMKLESCDAVTVRAGIERSKENGH